MIFKDKFMEREIKKVSIVIPCVNEEGNITRVLDEIIEITKESEYQFEVIVIDDGSKDKSWELIRDYAKKFDFIVGINQMGNFGQSQAYQAGFDHATGDYIITFSGDLEIPTLNILKVIELLDEDYDFVNTNRVKRWGNNLVMRKSKSGIANWLLNRISGIKIQDRGSGLKGMKANLAKELKFYGDMHRFIPDYLSIYKPRVIEFEVEFKEREYGQSAYRGSLRTIKVFLDMLTLAFLLRFAYMPFWMMPGRLFGFTGFLIGTVGFVVSAWMVIDRIFFGVGLTNRPLFILAVMMILIGLILLLFGLFGELMMRVYFEASDKKRYMIRELTK